MKRALRVEPIEDDTTHVIPPQPGYKYIKKKIPYFAPAEIDFTHPSLVKQALDGLKKKRETKPIKRNFWHWMTGVSTWLNNFWSGRR